MPNTSIEYLTPTHTTPSTGFYEDDELSEKIPEVKIQCGHSNSILSMGLIPNGSIGFVFEDQEGNAKGILLTHESVKAFLDQAQYLLTTKETQK